MGHSSSGHSQSVECSSGHGEQEGRRDQLDGSDGWGGGDGEVGGTRCWASVDRGERGSSSSAVRSAEPYEQSVVMSTGSAWVTEYRTEE